MRSVSKLSVMKLFATATVFVLGALCLAPALAWAQPSADLAIEAVRVRPSQAKAGETISVAATVRRVDSPSAKGAPPTAAQPTPAPGPQTAPAPAGPTAPSQFRTAQAGVALPDLVVDEIYWRWPYRLNYRLRNRGDAPTGPFQVAVYACPAPPRDPFTGTVGGPITFDEKPLEAGATRVRETTISQSSGTECKVRVVADSGGVVAEANENNNERTQVLSVPDLKIIDVERHRNGHPDVYFTVRVKNKGAVQSPPYRLSYMADPRGDYQAFSQGPFPPLAPGAVREHQASDQLWVGDHWLRIEVYTQFGSGEVFQDRATPRQYNKPPLTARLKITNVDRHRNGHPDVYITFRVKNMGTVASPRYRLEYSAGQSLPPQTFDGLAPGMVREHMVSDQLPAGERDLEIVLRSLPESAPVIKEDTATKRYNKRSTTALPDLKITNVDRHTATATRMRTSPSGSRTPAPDHRPRTGSGTGSPGTTIALMRTTRRPSSNHSSRPQTPHPG